MLSPIKRHVSFLRSFYIKTQLERDKSLRVQNNIYCCLFFLNSIKVNLKLAKSWNVFLFCWNVLKFTGFFLYVDNFLFCLYLFLFLLTTY